MEDGRCADPTYYMFLVKQWLFKDFKSQNVENLRLKMVSQNVGSGRVFVMYLNV